MCEEGRAQSPVDINSFIQGQPGTIAFNYHAAPLSVINNGHTIQVNYVPGSVLQLNGEEYELLQFHFHTPSEHHLSGEAAAMELHLVHRHANGELAVVGIMMQEGEEHSAIASIWENIPSEEGVLQSSETLMIDVNELLPNNQEYLSYEGSLTTPPCSEGVLWNVMVEPIEVSPEQIAAFEQYYPFNARPIQPTNERPIEHHH